MRNKIKCVNSGFFKGGTKLISAPFREICNSSFFLKVIQFMRTTMGLIFGL